MKEEKDLKKEETKKSNNNNKTKNANLKTDTSKKKGGTTTKKSNTTKTTSKKTSEKTTTAKNVSKAENTEKSTVKKATSKRTNTKKKEDETVDIAFIENDEKVDVKLDTEEAVETNNEKLLIDQKELEEKQMKAIREALKKNKKEKQNQANRQSKYKRILKNILIAIVETLYFLILIVGKAMIPTIEYITALKIFTIIEMIASVIIFEVSYKKDSEELFWHGIEMMIIAGATLIYLHYFSMQSDFLNTIVALIIGIISIYYLIKTIIIAVRKNKKK